MTQPPVPRVQRDRLAALVNMLSVCPFAGSATDVRTRQISINGKEC